MTKIEVYDKEDEYITSINVTKENSYNRILKRDKSLLDIILDNKIDIFYGCMGGSCSACVVTIISGDELIDKEGLHEQIYKKITENQVLSCITTIKDVEKEGTLKIKLNYKKTNSSAYSFA